jgi:type I restriction enzyme S subunit
MRITNVQQGFISNHNPKFVSIPENSKLKQFILNEGDILMSLTGDVGRVGIINKNNLPAALNQRVARIIIKNNIEIDKNFLFNLLNSDSMRNEIESLGHGAAQLNVSTKDILSIKVSIPPLEIQKKIVDKLDVIFREIDKATTTAELNAKNAEAIFQSYLTDTFVKGGSDWVEKSIEEITVKTKNINPEKLPNLEFKYVDVSSVSNADFCITNTQNLLGKDAPSRAKKNILTNDIIFATVRPTLKRVAIVPTELNNQVASTGYVVLRAKPNIHFKFIFFFLLSNIFIASMEKLQRGASYPAVTDDDVKSQKLKVPSYNEQIKAVKNLETLMLAISTIRKTQLLKIKELACLKNSILQQAFNGELIKE